MRIIIWTLKNSQMHTPTQKFVETMFAAGFVPTITKPTRITFETATLIDNIFLKGMGLLKYNSYVLVENISDHYPCALVLDMPGVKKPEGVFCLKKRVMNEKRYNKLNQHLLFHDWGVLNSLDVYESYSYLLNTISLYLEQVSPLKTITIAARESFREPWMTVQLCKYNSKCKKLFRKARKGRDVNLYEKYRMYRITLNRLKLHIKREFYSNLFTKIGKDSKTLWSVLNSLIRKTRNKVDVVELESDDGKLLKNPVEIGNAFNEHFASAGEKVKSKINKIDVDPLKYVKRVEQNLMLGNITESKLCHYVSKMKSKFSSGIDGITNDFLKKTVNCLKVPLCIIFNKSLNTGLFPSEMKIAKVCALYKAGDSRVKDNYRPISLLPVFSKILERYVYVQLVSHTEGK